VRNRLELGTSLGYICLTSMGKLYGGGMVNSYSTARSPIRNKFISFTFIVPQGSPTQFTLSIQISKCKKFMVTFVQICHINNLSCSHTYSKKTCCSVACKKAHYCCTTVCFIASIHCFCVQRKYTISNIIQLELYDMANFSAKLKPKSI